MSLLPQPITSRNASATGATYKTIFAHNAATTAATSHANPLVYAHLELGPKHDQCINVCSLHHEHLRAVGHNSVPHFIVVKAQLFEVYDSFTSSDKATFNKYLRHMRQQSHMSQLQLPQLHHAFARSSTCL